MEFKKLKQCRICGSKNLKKYLDLGRQPLANQLSDLPEKNPGRYPLQVLFCEECYLSQLSIVISPKILYKNYLYHSSVSNTFKKHCYDMAISLKMMFRDLAKPFVIDIASNDGCLLRQFKKAGYRVMGVEPSDDLADEAERKGVSTVHGFWNKGTAKRVPACDVITATNVLAHVDDLYGFIKLVKSTLRSLSKGVFVAEFPYLPNLIDGNQFDTIYHEHLSYFLLTPLVKLFSRCGIPIFNVKRYPIHGGSIRIYASPYSRHVDPSVLSMVEAEKYLGYYHFSKYVSYSKRVLKIKNDLRNMLAKFGPKNVIAYGASAKGISLLNYCEITANDLPLIMDDTPSKQGKYTPGGMIPILDPQFVNGCPKYILLLAWNFATELIEKSKHLGSRYIVPIPEVKVI